MSFYCRLVPFPAKNDPAYSSWLKAARTGVNNIDIGPFREPDTLDGVCNHHFDGPTLPYQRTNLIPTKYLPESLLTRGRCGLIGCQDGC